MNNRNVISEFEDAVSEMSAFDAAWNVLYQNNTTTQDVLDLHEHLQTSYLDQREMNMVIGTHNVRDVIIEGLQFENDEIGYADMSDVNKAAYDILCKR